MCGDCDLCFSANYATPMVTLKYESFIIYSIAYIHNLYFEAVSAEHYGVAP